MDVFCNADWAGGADRKSTSGYIITIAGGAIAWSSKKQNSVALSTAKAEYIAVTHTAKQILWQCSLFQELEIDLPTTSTIFSDTGLTFSFIALALRKALFSTKMVNIVYQGE